MRRLLAATLTLAIAAPALAKPPIWDQRIDSPKRWKVLAAFDSEAVLDKETGLVWEREPAVADVPWGAAFGGCASAVIGARAGWRLPTVYELRSLADLNAQSLPAGHPFAADSSIYWTSTTVPTELDNAYVGDLDGGAAQVFATDKLTNRRAWCVRGGIGPSGDAL